MVQIGSASRLITMRRNIYLSISPNKPEQVAVFVTHECKDRLDTLAVVAAHGFCFVTETLLFPGAVRSLSESGTRHHVTHRGPRLLACRSRRFGSGRAGRQATDTGAAIKPSQPVAAPWPATKQRMHRTEPLSPGCAVRGWPRPARARYSPTRGRSRPRPTPTAGPPQTAGTQYRRAPVPVAVRPPYIPRPQPVELSSAQQTTASQPSSPCTAATHKTFARRNSSCAYAPWPRLSPAPASSSTPSRPASPARRRWTRARCAPSRWGATATS